MAYKYKTYSDRNGTKYSFYQVKYILMEVILVLHLLVMLYSFISSDIKKITVTDQIDTPKLAHREL